MDKKYRLLLALAICIGILAPGISPAAQEGVPSSLVGVDEGQYTVCVDKSRQALYLYNGRQQTIALDCSTGMNPGDKQVEGDNRTPEGVYFPERMIDGQRLPNYYGWGAFVLNYPNPVDAAQGKNGDGIWIHGRAIPLKNRDTHGCVSLENDDLVKLAPYLHAYWTPVVTMKELSYADAGELEQRRSLYDARLDAWLSAWQSRDLEAFAACYAPGFVDGDKDLSTFLERKKRLFRKYRHIDIATLPPRIISCDEYTLACFLMDYCADGFRSRGVKYLYLENAGDNPRILREVFVPLEEAPQWAAQSEDLEHQERRELDAFISSWRQAWEQRDMARMRQCYDPVWPEDYFVNKAARLSRYDTLSVEFADLRVSRGETAWVVEARQHFSADSYEDTGIKRLRLVRDNGRFLITEERWERLE